MNSFFILPIYLSILMYIFHLSIFYMSKYIYLDIFQSRYLFVSSEATLELSLSLRLKRFGETWISRLLLKITVTFFLVKIEESNNFATYGRTSLMVYIFSIDFDYLSSMYLHICLCFFLSVISFYSFIHQFINLDDVIECSFSCKGGNKTDMCTRKFVMNRVIDW